MERPRHAPNVFGSEEQLHPEQDQFDPSTWTASVGTGDEGRVLRRTIVAIVRKGDDHTINSITRDDDPFAGEILR